MCKGVSRERKFLTLKMMRWLPRIFTASIVAALIVLPVTTSICLAHCEQTAAMSRMEHGPAMMHGCHGAAMAASHDPGQQMSDSPATCGQVHLSWTAIVNGSAPLAPELPVAWIAGIAAYSPRALVIRDEAGNSPLDVISVAPADSRLIPLRI
jgi:hypothetical protein